MQNHVLLFNSKRNIKFLLKMNRKSFLSKFLIGIPAIIASPQILSALKTEKAEIPTFQIKITGSEAVPFQFQIKDTKAFETPSGEIWTIILDNKFSY